MEELKKLPIEREEYNFEQGLRNLEPKKKTKISDIFIGLALVIILIAGSYAASYYLPQNSPVNIGYYRQGVIDTANEINNNATIPLWNSEKQGFEWTSIGQVCQSMMQG